jgi:hypothetical protein
MTTSVGEACDGKLIFIPSQKQRKQTNKPEISPPTQGLSAPSASLKNIYNCSNYLFIYESSRECASAIVNKLKKLTTLQLLLPQAKCFRSAESRIERADGGTIHKAPSVIKMRHSISKNTSLWRTRQHHNERGRERRRMGRADKGREMGKHIRMNN